ncbi:hypothetical protein ABPG77_005616 [Micractinium sp. CCAP 211/92]
MQSARAWSSPSTQACLAACPSLYTPTCALGRSLIAAEGLDVSHVCHKVLKGTAPKLECLSAFHDIGAHSTGEATHSMAACTACANRLISHSQKACLAGRKARVLATRTAWLTSAAGNKEAAAFHTPLFASGLAEWLREQQVYALYVCGVATDHCVRASVLDGLQAGFQVALLTDAGRRAGSWRRWA